MHLPGNVIGGGVHAPCMRGQQTRMDRVCSISQARCLPFGLLGEKSEYVVVKDHKVSILGFSSLRSGA